jgi:hypothetical protein
VLEKENDNTGLCSVAVVFIFKLRWIKVEREARQLGRFAYK